MPRSLHIRATSARAAPRDDERLLSTRRRERACLAPSSSGSVRSVPALPSRHQLLAAPPAELKPLGLAGGTDACVPLPHTLSFERFRRRLAVTSGWLRRPIRSTHHVISRTRDRYHYLTLSSARTVPGIDDVRMRARAPFRLSRARVWSDRSYRCASCMSQSWRHSRASLSTGGDPDGPFAFAVLDGVTPSARSTTSASKPHVTRGRD